MTLLSIEEDLLAGQYPAPGGDDDSGRGPTRHHDPVSTAGPPRTRAVLPLLGWLLIALPLAASTQLTGDTTWASGVLDGGSRVAAAQEDLVQLPGYGATVVLAFAGLGAGTFFGLAAVPGSLRARWVVTGVVLAALVGMWTITAVVEKDPVVGELVGGAAITLLPAALLLTLVRRRARHGSARAALLLVVVGVVAHGITLGRLLDSAGDPALGAWLMLLLELVALAGAVLVLRTVPTRSPVSPARIG